MNHPPLNPGDDAAPGTPDTGADIRPVCGGSGGTDTGAGENHGCTGKAIHGIGRA